MKLKWGGLVGQGPEAIIASLAAETNLAELPGSLAEALKRMARMAAGELVAVSVADEAALGQLAFELRLKSQTQVQRSHTA